MGAGRASQRSFVARGRTLRGLDVQAEKVKGLWFDCEEWEGWEPEDDYQVTGGKFEGRQQWDHRSLPDTSGEDKTVAWGLEVSGGSEPGSDAQSRDDLGCPGTVKRSTCLRWRDTGGISDGRGRWSSHCLVGSHPLFIVAGLIEYLLETTHVKLISDTASWAGPERRLMVIRPLSCVRQCDRGGTWRETRRGGLVPLSRLDDVDFLLFVAQVLIERSRIVVVDSSAGAIAPSSSLQIITGPTFGQTLEEGAGELVEEGQNHLGGPQALLATAETCPDFWHSRTVRGNGIG